jgi:hypothetical protein
MGGHRDSFRSRNAVRARFGTPGRIVALLLASTTFVQTAVSEPGDIFMTAAPVIGSDPPKSRDIKDGDASVATQTGSLQYSYPIELPPGRSATYQGFRATSERRAA